MVRPDVVGQRRTWSITTSGISSRDEKRAIFWKHFNAGTSAKHDSGLPVRFSAQVTSSDDGVKNTCSTRADVSRLNCG